MKKRKITITVYRNHESVNELTSSYELSITPETSLLDSLLFIKENLDSSITFRRSCECGICGSCAVNINGRNELACESLLWKQKKQVTVKPLPAFPVITDLVVDLTSYYDGIKEILVSSTENNRQSEKERQKLDGFYECIHCGACSSSCPVFWRKDTYSGPAILMKGWADLADSRKSNKNELINRLVHDGIWECRLFMNCVQACSKGLNPADAVVNIRNYVEKGSI